MKEYLLRHMPPDYSVHGHDIDNLIVDMHVVMAILFVFWALFFAYTLIRFRAKKQPQASYTGMRSRWSLYLVAVTALVEFVHLFGVSIPAWGKWSSPPSMEGNPLVVHVIAEQFAWNVQYPGPDNIFGRRNINLVSPDNPLGLDPTDPHGKDDIATINELHLQVNRPVIIHVFSKDVIHSFKLPVLRVEQDAVPGMDIPIHFTPTRTNNGDDWEIACAQLCGLAHYRMRGMLMVDTKADLDSWLESMAPEPAATEAPVAEAAPAEAATTNPTS